MHTNVLGKVLLVLMVWSILFASCGQDPVSPPGERILLDTTPVDIRLQLNDLPQPQFAGYYAAQDRGYYQKEGLSVTIAPGGPEVSPEQIVASGQAQFGIGRITTLLVMRDRGIPLVNIAQVFTLSGTRSILWDDRHIVGPDELSSIGSDQGETAMLEDGIFVSENWLLAEPQNKDLAARFLRASFRGWEFCRDVPEKCVDLVLRHGGDGAMTGTAQQWRMDEVNAQIWGNPIDPNTQIGYLAPETFERIASLALDRGLISKPASSQAYTHEIWYMANSQNRHHNPHFSWFDFNWVEGKEGEASLD